MVFVCVSAGVSFNSQVTEEGYFRPESPWIPGNRKVKQDPVELTSYTARDTVTSAASVSINNLTASWKGEEGKTVLNRITFDLNEVWLSSVITVIMSFNTLDGSTAYCCWTCRGGKGQ